jgi:hypothetical protein
MTYGELIHFNNDALEIFHWRFGDRQDNYVSIFNGHDGSVSLLARLHHFLPVPN